MTPERRKLVLESWKLLNPHSEQLGMAFYRRLFEIDPEIRLLFASTILEEQIHKLTTMLDLVVHWLDVPERLVPVLKQLGARHANYGITDDHFAKMGTALIGALEEQLGDRFTNEVRSAWNEAYLLISALMRRGAAKVSGAFPVFTLDPASSEPQGDAA
jgi:hemoglobin-like flavoprotein